MIIMSIYHKLRVVMRGKRSMTSNLKHIGLPLQLHKKLGPPSLRIIIALRSLPINATIVIR